MATGHLKGESARHATYRFDAVRHRRCEDDARMMRGGCEEGMVKWHGFSDLCAHDWVICLQAVASQVFRPPGRVFFSSRLPGQ